MEDAIESIKQYMRAANYLSAAQIYLMNNCLLEQPLTFADIKPRLLGHWGTCPGINFIYAHLNYLIKKHKSSILFVLGPGHGYAALQANLFIEGTLKKYYPEATHTEQGIAYLIKNFCWPYGFPSHSNPGTPGVILEGGELGYSLATAYGAALDNPNLIVACVIGDGEAETGPTATAWHLNKFIDPATNGAVLPILHLNGYKISGPTLFGRMSNKELKSLFYGYGYQPFIVEGQAIHQKMMGALDQCYQTIRAIQESARKGNLKTPPRLPMMILKTLKGWTGIKTLHGQKIEGNCLSHQVVVTQAKTDRSELRLLEQWLRSYHFETLFNKENGFNEHIRSLVPDSKLCMGNSRHAFGGKPQVKALKLPTIEHIAEDATTPGTIGSSSMRCTGIYLNELCQFNTIHRNFRLFSPDETYSNKLDKIFETTQRANVQLKKAWDKDISSDGRVIEMLSEHALQGLMQGYVLTGRHAIFASYEAFIQIVSSMTDQYMKFLQIARNIPWRGDIPSLNYILTSSGWRQEHNGFSHQNPGFISNLLQKHGCFTRAFFPPDATTMLVVLERCLTSCNAVNVIVAGKTLEPRWLTPELARKELEQGLMIWDFASDLNPDIVLAAAGDYLTKEALAAITLIQEDMPSIKIRFVNILELSALGFGNSDCSFSKNNFNDYFTENKPVIFNFHGYPSVLQQLLFTMGDTSRFHIHGYVENGSTTTPFDMHIRNKTSRWHLAKEVFSLMAEQKVIPQQDSAALNKKYDNKLSEHRVYIKKHGIDPDEIEQWQWK
ncbi:phosphoketolase family protein [Legionella fallonii]|uniref:Phosphoketolase n=1 Tax=Legionella fallonii LLAP-10 TaxID=1212491 RepID=A0A098GAW7_9GAMM|nr:phosphoketolase family protein [Legionella fallonii]CEG59127.1 Phosphoketolase [Legionella fallonii LLAP-10]